MWQKIIDREEAFLFDIKKGMQKATVSEIKVAKSRIRRAKNQLKKNPTKRGKKWQPINY